MYPGDCPSVLRIISGWVSERVEPGQQIRVAFPAWGISGSGGVIDLLDGSALRLEVRAGVVVRRIEADVPEQAADGREIDAGGDHLDTHGVAERVWMHAFALKGRQFLGRGLNVAGFPSWGPPDFLSWVPP